MNTETDPREGRELKAIFHATRLLLWIGSREEAASIARLLCQELGGDVVDAASAGPDTLPIDLSFGTSKPVLPSAPVGSPARTSLERHLGTFVLDANRAVALIDRTGRLAEDAERDPLTAMPNRRAVGRALGRLRAGDVVVMIDLDHFKEVNDNFGHDEGDAVLVSFASVLEGILRSEDFAGRYGGEEFVIVLPTGSHPEVVVERLRERWEAARPRKVSFSAGVAVAGTRPREALDAADAAMYLAKQEGRDTWRWADPRGIGG